MKARCPLKWRLLFVKIRLICDPNFRNSKALDQGYRIVKGSNGLNLLRLFVNGVVEVMTCQISRVEVSDSTQTIVKKGTTNFLIHKTFTSIFSGDYLCRSYVAAHLSQSKLWFPLSKEMRLQAKVLGISTSGFICALLWFVFKLKRVAGAILREILRTKWVLKVGQRGDAFVYVIDANLIQAKQQHIQVLLRFAYWFVNIPNSVKNQFMTTPSLSDETSIRLNDTAKIHKIEESILQRIMISLLVINHELAPLSSIRGINEFAINQLFAIRFRNSLDKFSNKNSLFLVPSNSGITRPIWTYLFDSLGSDFAFIELSSGLDPNPFKGDLLNYNGLNTWANVYSPSRIAPIIPNSFSSSPANNWTRIPEWGSSMEYRLKNYNHESKKISVFDLEPLKNWYGISTLNEMGYNEIHVVSNFLRNIVEQANSLGIVVFHKPKRKIGQARLSEYSSLILDLAREYPSNYIIVPEEIIPTDLIKLTNGTISMPCTSTAIMAHDLMVPSIYYDSTCLIDSDDSATKGIRVIQKSIDLASWLRNL